MQAIRADVRADMNIQSRQIDNAGTRVDNAIQDMQKQFKELAGMQLRKPVLECFLGGSSLDGSILKFSPNLRDQNINIKNIGDASARNIKIRLYTNLTPEECNSFYGGGGEWRFLNASDEPDYGCVFESYEQQPIDPKESRPININLFNSFKTGNYRALLKVFYEQPEPKKYSFTISMSDK
jgi:hypothetical protein